MTLAIDSIELSNKAHRELITAKEEQGNTVLAIHFTVKGVLPAVHF